MKVEMSYKGPTVFTDNDVSDELVHNVKVACLQHDFVCVSFDVTGRTCHTVLSHQLAHELGDSYDVEIEYWSYLCKVRKVER